MTFYAHLVVHCDKETHRLLGASVYSSPTWEQRLFSGSHPSYTAFRVGGTSYQNAHDNLVQIIKDEKSYWHYLYEHLGPDDKLVSAEARLESAARQLAALAGKGHVGIDTSRNVVILYLEKKPVLVIIPKKIDGFDVEIKVIGKVRPL